jgi:hypothetical protein
MPNLLKFVKPMRKRDCMADAIADRSWAHAFSGVPSVAAITEFMDLWARLREVQVAQGNADTVRW